jgi:hypothetical protein
MKVQNNEKQLKLAEKIGEKLLKYSELNKITISQTFKKFNVPFNLEKRSFKELSGINGSLIVRLNKGE